MEVIFGALVELLVYALLEAVCGAVARVMTRSDFADIAVITAIAATFVVGLVLLRDLDVFSVSALLVVAAIVGWAVHSSLDRLLSGDRARAGDASTD